MANCVIEPSLSSVYRALVKKVGNVEAIALTMYFNIHNNGTYDPKFLDWYKSTTGKDFLDSIVNENEATEESNKSNREVADNIYKYFYKDDPSISKYTTRNENEDISAKYGYSKLGDREKGKTHIAHIILREYVNAIANNIDLRKEGINYIAKKVSIGIRKAIFDYHKKVIGTDKEYSQLNKELIHAENPDAYLRSLLGNNETDIAKNLYALYNEFNDDISKYLNEVFTDDMLYPVYKLINNIKEDIQQETIDAAGEVNDIKNREEENKKTYDVEDAIGQLNSHGGHFTSFTKHLSERLKIYFNNLEKLEVSKDTDTPIIDDRFGLAEYLDPTSCMIALYNGAPYNNKQELIDTINKIANYVPGFAGFKKFANDLSIDGDLANEVLSVFGKTKIDKKQVRIKNGKVEIFISNAQSSPSHVMSGNIINDLRGSIINFDHDVTISTINNLISDINKSNANIEELKVKAINLIRSYCPSINEKTIEAYINLNGIKRNANVDNQRKQNIKQILKFLTDIANNAKSAKVTYNLLQDDIKKAEEKIEELNDARERGVWVETSQYPDIESLRNKDYTSNLNNNVATLTNTLLDYAFVPTSLNSTNALRNQSSDVINNSYITRNNNIFSTKDVNKLQRYGERKFRTASIKYNPILCSQHGLTNGVFNENGGNISINATNDEIIFSLFDGTRNEDNDKASVYSGMNSGDYAPTVLSGFFGTDNVNVANYFLRIPSDAPKTYMLQAPRYVTSSLITYNEKELENTAIEILNSFPRLDANLVKEWFNNNKYEEVDLSNLAELIITNPSRKWIKNLDKVIPVDGTDELTNGKEVYMLYTTNLPTEQDDADWRLYKTQTSITYIVKGTYRKANNGNLIENPKVVSMGNTYNWNSDTIKFPTDPRNPNNPNTTKNKLIRYYVEQLKNKDFEINGKVYNRVLPNIDRNSKVFSILRNIRKGELLDMAVALDHYFEMLPSGAINAFNKKGELVFKEGASNTKGYDNYHLKNGELVKLNKDTGLYELVGNVFNQSKFTIYNKETQKDVNYMDDHMDKGHPENYDEEDGSIHLLYGGTNNSLQVVRNEEGKVVDITLTDKQISAIDDCIEKWLQDFVSNGIVEFSKYEKYIDAKYRGTDNAVNFLINNFIALSAMDDLIEGPTNFYKDIQTFFKRTKEGQGSGVPYGNIDYNTPDVETVEEARIPIEDSYLTSGFFTKLDENGRPYNQSVREIFENAGFSGLTARRGFVGITITNSKFKSFDSLKPLEDILTKLYIKNGIAEKNARERAKKLLGGYDGTKVNDAQSYITFEEWVRRIEGRGQLRRYMPTIEKILDPNYELSGKEIEEFIQVQKNFYFDLHYDAAYGREAPRQIKNAEFVLVPKLIKGTELETIYNLMRDCKIDQLNTVETSKAANEELITLWDNKGVLFKKAIDNFKEKANSLAQAYDYKYLYTQQETPQHMNSENKAGVQIVKKILDNIEPGSKLYPLANRFFSLFTTNIEESYKDLLNRFEIPTDKNGDLILDSNGRITGLNKKVLYDKIMDEMRRQGLDNNMLDFVEIREGETEPFMPAITPNVLSKFESVVQSVFNNKITRQTLPGFHAAQVTQIGFGSNNPKPYIHKEKGKAITKEQYEKLSAKDQNKYYDSRVQYSKDLKYHPVDEDGNAQGYIEIMVPATCFNFGKKYKTLEEKLQALQDAGLDKIIGYRIPTEGKQSICNMKIVGLLDEAYGSTIIVPNEWVAQTGSDFDIDSVYAIQAESYIDKDGTLKRVEFQNSFDKTDYIKYVRRTCKATEEEKNISKEKKERIKAINSEYEEKYLALQAEENELYSTIYDIPVKEDYNVGNTTAKQLIKNYTIKGKKLNYNFGTLIKALHSAYYKQLKNQELSNRDKYITQLGNAINDLADLINNYSEDFSKDQIDLLLKFHQANINLYNQITNEYDNYINNKEEYIEVTDNNAFKALEKRAVDAGLMSYTQWSSQSIYQKNSRKSRNTAIFDTMWDILAAPESLEENLSRSNFDDIRDVLNSSYLPSSFRKERTCRSPYNIFDQIKFQEDAMSGAKLKGMSVALDGFCSICNRVRPKVEEVHQQLVTYNIEDIDDMSQIIKGFTIEEKNKKTVTVRHDKYGWSNTNRAVSGKLLTAYSSQTTAYILDNIKEGSIPNINDYTFTTYKTMLNIGIDYKTAICFMMQPGITEIVDKYSANKSVFGESYGNPIHQAIHTIGKKLGINVSDRTGIGIIIQQLNNQFGDRFNQLLGTTDNPIKISLKQSELKNIPININLLVDRLNNKNLFKNSSPVEDNVNSLLFDLATILTFHKLHNTASKVSDIARVCNPDKFGAKATVYETREVLDNIFDCIYSEDNFSGEIVEKDRVLTAENNLGEEVHILQAIYPNIKKGSNNSVLKYIMEDMDIDDSKYPSLAAFLKYSTAFSITCAQEVLPTESPAFVDACKGLAKCFSGHNNQLSEEEYDNFKKYLLNYLFSQCLTIAHPISVIIDDNGNISYEPDHTKSAFYERQRIFGYRSQPNLRIRKRIVEKGQGENNKDRIYYVDEEVKFKDIDNPTEEELNTFNKLSPAQKVQWIKTYYTYDKGIFEYYNVNLNNVGAMGTYAGMQTISYNSELLESNVAYELFTKAFSSSNPIIKLAAFDIIKYASAVDGFQMKKTGVNKTIANYALYTPAFYGGTGIVDEVTSMINYIKYLFDDESIGRTVYEQYLRSNINPNIRRLRLTQENKRNYNITQSSKGMYYIPVGTRSIDEFNADMASAGIKAEPISETSGYKTNEYIYLTNSNKETHLYRIINGNFGIYLYPFNPLQNNETTSYSAKPSNNTKYPSKEGFELLIKKLENERNQQNIDISLERTEELAKEIELNKYYNNVREITKERTTIDFNIETLAKDPTSGMWQTRDIIANHFSTSNEVLYVDSIPLTNYIFDPGVNNSSPQKIKLNDGTTKDVKIEKVRLDKKEKGYIKGTVEKIDKVTDNKALKKILENKKINKVTNPSTIFKVYENTNANDEVMESSIGLSELDNLVSENVNFLRLRVMSGDDLDAISIMEKFKRIGANSSLTAIQENQEAIIRELSRYALTTSKALNKKIKNFVKDPDNDSEYLSINNERVQALLLKDKNLTEEYLKTINEARAFISTFKPWFEFKIESDSRAIEIFITDIINSVKNIESLSEIKDAEEKFARGFVLSITDNPVYQDKLVDILVGMHKTYGTMWRFHDLLENGTALLQTIMKEVNGNLEARRLQTEQYIKDFRNKLAKIEQEARKNGKSIDISKFVTKNGTYVQEYNQSFSDTYSLLQDDITASIASYDLGSIEHLNSKLLLDQFEAMYLNKPAKQEYYIEKTKLEAQILSKFPELYSEYMKLWYKASDLYKYIKDKGSNKEITKQLEDVRDKMRNLYRPGKYLNEYGELVNRIRIDEYPENSTNAKLYSLEAAKALNDYIYYTKILTNKYFENKDVPGFKQQLEENLRIIRSLEERDSNNIPKHTQDYLMTIPEYRMAKEWLMDNAYYAIDYNKAIDNTILDLNSLIDPEDRTDGIFTNSDTIGEALTRILNTLHIGGKGRTNTYIDLAKIFNIHDEYNIPNPFKLGNTVEEVKENIAKIKHTQEENYKKNFIPEYSDLTLINSVRIPNNVLYNKDFYYNMMPDGELNKEYIIHVTNINNLVKPLYDDIDGTIHFEKILDTKEGRDILKQLANEYWILHRIKKYSNSTNKESVKQWIDEKVDFVTNDEAYKAQWAAAFEHKSGEWIKLWTLVNSELDDAGNPIQREDSNGNKVFASNGLPVYQPNKFIYSYCKPKDSLSKEEIDSFIDKNKTLYNYIVNKIFKTTKSAYYYKAMNKAQTNPSELGFNSYFEWYQANHIYNPYTHVMEPVECWLQVTYSDSDVAQMYNLGEWLPKGDQVEKVVKDGTTDEDDLETEDMRNPDYNPDNTLAGNYIKGADNGRFDSNADLNEYEIQFRDEMKKAIYEFAISKKAKKRADRGFIPVEGKRKEQSAKEIFKESAKILGVDFTRRGTKNDYKKEISYQTDYVPDIPMTSMLVSEGGEVEYDPNKNVDTDYIGQTIKLPTERPLRENYNSPEDYYVAINEWNKLRKKIMKHNEDVHGSLIGNTNWVDNICNYITYANDIKAVQENKQLVYYLRNMIDKMDMINRKYGLFGDLETTKGSTEENPVYESYNDKDLSNQLDTYLTRLLFNHYQRPGSWLLTFANGIQNFTSANYMMLNYRGGIANVAYGESQIYAEAAAREHFNKKEWAIGVSEYRKGIISYCSGMYSMLSTTKQDAIIKYCNVVDYDEINGIVRTVDYKTYSERVRNFMFHPQTATEHFMQNSVLFAMLHSNKIVENPDDKTGIGYTYMTESEYVRVKLASELKNILTKEQQDAFENMKEEVRKDLNKAKDYAWFRRDILTQFVRRLNTEQQLKFFEIKKAKEDEFKKEFAKKDTMYSQLTLKEGKLAFVEGSTLDKLNARIDAKGITYANNIMGRFINRARSVNNKIHGVYNRKGAAWIEQFWLGRLIMQYHKHIPMGILKRYRLRGYYNETRGSVEKGTYTTLIDLLTMPLDKLKEDGVSTTDIENIKGLQNIISAIVDYSINLQICAKLLPDYEKANVRRLLANAKIVLLTLGLTILLQALGDDDDDDSIPYNLALYELDRLSSEAFYYTPIGLGTESKKLMSTPIAAQSIVNDVFKTGTELASLMFGDEETGFYASGRFAGESKYKVFLERRIPGWHGIKTILDTPKNNHYFKIGQNVNGMFNAKAKADDLKELLDL